MLTFYQVISKEKADGSVEWFLDGSYRGEPLGPFNSEKAAYALAKEKNLRVVWQHPSIYEEWLSTDV